MAIYQRGGKYYISFSCDGQWVRKVAGRTKKEAAEALEAIRTDIRRGDLHFKGQCKVTFKEYAQRYMEEFSKVHKRSWRRDLASLKNLVPFFGEFRMGKINPFLIEQYQSKRTQNVKPATVNREMALFKHIFTRAVEQEIVMANPVKRVKFFKVDNIVNNNLTPEKVTRLLSVCPEFIRPIVLTAIHTGMRRHEILDLQWADVDLSKGLIHVIKSKSGKDRWIPINKTLMETLLQLKRGARTEKVFPLERKKRHADLEWHWKKIVRDSGIGKCRFHDLRHFHATRLVELGVDLVTVQNLLGHSNIQVTIRYAHSSPQSQREAVHRLDSALYVASDSERVAQAAAV